MSVSNGYSSVLFLILGSVLLILPADALNPRPHNHRAGCNKPTNRMHESSSENQPKLREIHSWRALDFYYPDKSSRSEAIKNGSFVPGAPVPIDTDVYYGKKSSVVFITIPRWQQGVPVTLGYITNRVHKGNRLIAPYPDWNWHNKPGNCDGLTSVFRVTVDECDRLWVLDTGKLENVQKCPPQLLSFDLKTNKLISRYKFPKDQYKQNSLFTAFVLDIRNSIGGGKCGETFVYIADPVDFALLVYDHGRSKSWVIRNNLFFPYPPHGTITINSESFDLMDGIFALALGSFQPNINDKMLYFHSLASTTESYVQTSVIRNASMFENPNAAARQFKSFPMQRSTQATAQFMNGRGILFFGLASENAIGCWNSNRHYYGNHSIDRIAVDKEKLQFTSGLKIVKQKQNSDEIWFLTSTLQKFMTGSISSKEKNFWILKGNVRELTEGTRCGVPQPFPNRRNRLQC